MALLTLTAGVSFSVMHGLCRLPHLLLSCRGWIVIPLGVSRRSLQHLPWLFLHVFLHYIERALKMCQTENRAVPPHCQWKCGWAWVWGSVQGKLLRTVIHFLSLSREMLFSPCVNTTKSLQSGFWQEGYMTENKWWQIVHWRTWVL